MITAGAAVGQVVADLIRKNPGVTHLHQCYECSTLTTNPPTNGVTLCNKHQEKTP